MLSYLLATVALAGPGPRSDADIADAIETELFLQEGVAAWPIDIDVRKGVVTLTGTLPHLLAADRARDVTAAVRGVRSVVDRLEVAPLPRDDEDIYDDVTHRLAENPVTEAWEVDVGVDEGRVKLTGTVDSWHEKDLAARVARSVSGVHRVDDDLTWRPEKDRADPEIRAEIVDAVRWDVRLQAPAIDVAVRKGRVKLSGTVGSHQQKLLAERHAWVTGVHQVRTNQLEVQAWADVDALDDPAPDAVSDEGIADAVVDAWVYDPRVAAWQPELQVHDGAVTLRGIVPSFEARQAAEEDARNTRGVRLVRNRLRVRPEEPVPDDTLQGRVRESLQADPSAAIGDVTVRVRQGVVELGGTVRTAWEQRRAEDLAATIQGVVFVDNDIEVEPLVDRVPRADAPRSSWPDADRALLETVRSQLYWSPFVDLEQLEVTVNAGEVTLGGTVDSWFERYHALENARDAGAARVVDELTRAGDG